MKTLDPKTISALQDAGYDAEVGDEQASALITIQGKESCGKTEWALKAPSPIAYHALDTGDDGVIQKARAAGKVIFPMQHNYSFPPEKRVVPKFPPRRVEKESGKSIPSEEEIAFYDDRARWVRENCWDRFENALDKAAGLCRSIVIDTETEAYEMKRQSKFGKLLQVPQLSYSELNGEYKEMFRRLKKRGVTIILIRQLKEKFDSPGVWIPQGMNKIDYLVDWSLEFSFVPSVTVAGKTRPCVFRAKVLKSRQAVERTGMTIELPGFDEGSSAFTQVATLLKPKVDADAWED